MRNCGDAGSQRSLWFQWDGNEVHAVLLQMKMAHWWELVAPCGGNAFSLGANAVSVSAPCGRAGPASSAAMPSGALVSGRPNVQSGVTAARLYLSPLHGWFDAA